MRQRNGTTNAHRSAAGVNAINTQWCGIVICVYTAVTRNAQTSGVRFVEGNAPRRGLNVVQSSEKLPKFNKPPVVEVVLGVQFQQLAGFHVGHHGAIWQRFQGKFSRVQQQPRLPHIIERKGVQPPEMLNVMSLMSPSDHVPRMWLLSADDTELVQVQPDRFMRNWRRYHDGQIAYPSYDDHIRPGFVEDFANFSAVIEDQQLGPPIADQCEVVYVNHIDHSGTWQDFSQLGRVFKGWDATYPHSVGSGTDTVAYRMRRDVTDDHGKFVGHFFIELDSAYSLRQTGAMTPIFQLQLNVRGRPLSEGAEGVMRFMDLAHKIIVNSFAELTTPEMHAIWERIQ